MTEVGGLLLQQSTLTRNTTDHSYYFELLGFRIERVTYHSYIGMRVIVETNSLWNYFFCSTKNYKLPSEQKSSVL